MRHLVCLALCACAAPPRPASPPPAAPDFGYDAHAALDLRDDGAAERWDTIAIQRLSFASPRGGRVPALLVTPVEPGERRAAVLFQHGMGQLDKTELLPDAVLVARAGGIALLVDAPDQRPGAERYADHQNDRELWEHAAVDLRRAVDVLVARTDIDAARIGFCGHSFGASEGAILAAVEPRIHAVALIAPGDLTRAIRESTAPPMVALRAHVPPRALEGYLGEMAPLDASRFLARVPATTSVLLQFGAYDAGTSERADAELAARSTGRTEQHRYPTGHFIVSIDAARDRLAFFVRELQLPHPDVVGSAGGDPGVHRRQ